MSYNNLMGRYNHSLCDRRPFGTARKSTYWPPS